MAIYFKANFTDDGAPRTGISPVPTITIMRLSDDAEVVADKNMSEVGRGWYKYDFTSAYVAGEEYAATADAGAAIISIERYAYG